MKKISDEHKQKIKQSYVKNQDESEIKKQKLVKQIQIESKEKLIPTLKEQMAKTTNLIVNLLNEKGEERVNNIQIMSLIAQRSTLEIANAGNITYTPQEIMAGFNLYLEMINKINDIKKFPPTVESFTAFMGISRTTYNNWLADMDKKSVMDYIHSYLLGVLAVGGLTGETKEISSMFLAKTMGKTEVTNPIVVKHEVETNVDEIQKQIQVLKKEKVIDVEWEEQDD